MLPEIYIFLNALCCGFWTLQGDETKKTPFGVFNSIEISLKKI